MNTGTILVVGSGKIIPSEFKTKLLNTHKTALGYAVAENGVVDMLTLDGEEPDEKGNVIDLAPTLDEMELGFMNIPRVYHLSNHATRMDDEQPYPIIVDKDKVLLACVAEGDFPGYTQKDSTHSNEYHMITDYLADACKEVYQEAEEDVAKMMEIFASPRFRKGMLGILAPRGTIVLIGSEGEPVIFSKNDDGHNYDWGYASKALIEEKKAAPPPTAKAEPVKEMTAAEKHKARMAARAAGGGPVTSGVPAVKEKTPQPEVVGKLADPPAKNEEHIFWDKRLEGRALKNLIRNNFNLSTWGGQLPPDWKNLKYLPAKLLKPGSTLKPFTKSFQEAGAELKAHQQQDPEVTADPPAMVGPKEKQNVLRLNQQADISHTPEELLTAVKKYPPFSEQVQIPIEEILLWKFASYKEMGVWALACLANEYRHMLLKFMPDVLKKPVVQAETVQEEEPVDNRTPAQKHQDRIKARAALAEKAQARAM